METQPEREGAVGTTLRLAGLSEMARRFLDELSKMGLASGPGPGGPVRGEDIAKLPESVRRYLIFMGVMGRPRDWSFRLHFTGRFRLRPDHDWTVSDVWEYATSLGVARVIRQEVAVGGVVPAVGRDTYLEGHGRSRVRLFDLLPIADDRGEELDADELVTYLHDAILLAPSMLLGPATTWTSADDSTFEVSLSDRGHAVTVGVSLDSRGAPTQVSSDDRFCHDPFTRGHPLMRALWTTRVGGWSGERTRPLPTGLSSRWSLPGGEFECVEMPSLAEGIAFNLPPGL